jgi:hypothetical protein
MFIIVLQLCVLAALAVTAGVVLPLIEVVARAAH